MVETSYYRFRKKWEISGDRELAHFIENSKKRKGKGLILAKGYNFKKEFCKIQLCVYVHLCKHRIL